MTTPSEHVHSVGLGGNTTASEAACWAEIDLAAVTHNARVMRARLHRDCELMAVVKADAYGHGLVPCARAALRGGAECLAVGYLPEARILRERGLDVPLLKIVPAHDEATVAAGVDLDVEEIVQDLDQARMVSAVAERRGVRIPVHIKIDTGMGRLGIWWEDAAEALREIGKLPGLRVIGLLSHLPDAEAEESTFSLTQGRRFESVAEAARELGIGKTRRHLANSGGAVYAEELQYDTVRSGIALYGLSPRGADGFAGQLRPAMTWKARVLQVKRIPAGESIGYGRTHRVDEDTRIAVLAAGYADGLARSLSGCGEVLLNGRRAPILGIVSMNLCAVKADGAGEVKRGDEAVLVGAQGDDCLSAWEMAEKCGTIHYEVVTRIGRSCPRVYRDGE